MTKVTQTITDSLGITEADALRIQNAVDTTFDGSKWSEASHKQIVVTAAYLAPFLFGKVGA